MHALPSKLPNGRTGEDRSAPSAPRDESGERVCGASAGVAGCEIGSVRSAAKASPRESVRRWEKVGEGRRRREKVGEGGKMWEKVPHTCESLQQRLVHSLSQLLIHRDRLLQTTHQRARRLCGRQLVAPHVLDQQCLLAAVCRDLPYEFGRPRIHCLHLWHA